MSAYIKRLKVCQGKDRTTEGNEDLIGEKEFNRERGNSFTVGEVLTQKRRRTNML